jgi:N-acetylneuraminic acid mutarotase
MNLKFERISGHSLTRIGNYFYVFGGQVTGTFSDKLYKLNTKSNQLDIVDNTVGETPDNRAYHSAIAYGSKIIFFGGLNWHQVFD